MPGKIKVKILAGRNLPVMDRSGDTTDAYVEIKFGNTTYKTDVCRKSLNPQWNSEWYRFEVDDAELQDEPLQIRLMDHDTYSANDAIGKVYVNLNSLLLPGVPPPVKNIWTLEATMNSSAGAQGGSVMTGWIPVYDTMHGIRGEVNIIVKVELFSDFNKFRQSSCGVQFFYSPNIPYGYHAQVIHGFVEELIVCDDPEYKWIDKIRTPRASNEARQTLFFKLSGEVQRKIGLKALDLGGNAVIGYLQNFDLEGESGIVARGIGTAVTLGKLYDMFNIPAEVPNLDDFASSLYSQPECADPDETQLIPNTPNRSPILALKHQVPPPTFINESFQNPKKPSKTPLRVSEYRGTSRKQKLRQMSLQSSYPSQSYPSQSYLMGKRNATSTLSLTDDLIDELSLKTMLALEDMRGEPSGNRFSRGLKTLRYLPKKVHHLRSRFSEVSFDEESDLDSTYSSSWSIGTNTDSTRSSLLEELHQSRKLKKRNTGEGVAALLIRSVHSSLPLDSVREDRETPTPSPIKFLGDFSEKELEGEAQEPSRKDLGDSIPMISSSETDTSTSDEDEEEEEEDLSESSTNYNILEDSASLLETCVISNAVDWKSLENQSKAFKEDLEATRLLANSDEDEDQTPKRILPEVVAVLRKDQLEKFQEKLILESGKEGDETVESGRIENSSGFQKEVPKSTMLEFQGKKETGKPELELNKSLEDLFKLNLEPEQQVGRETPGFFGTPKGDEVLGSTERGEKLIPGLLDFNENQEFAALPEVSSNLLESGLKEEGQKSVPLEFQRKKETGELEPEVHKSLEDLFNINLEPEQPIGRETPGFFGISKRDEVPGLTERNEKLISPLLDFNENQEIAALPKVSTNLLESGSKREGQKSVPLEIQRKKKTEESEHEVHKSLEDLFKMNLKPEQPVGTSNLLEPKSKEKISSESSRDDQLISNFFQISGNFGRTSAPTPLVSPPGGSLDKSQELPFPVKAKLHFRQSKAAPKLATISSSMSSREVEFLYDSEDALPVASSTPVESHSPEESKFPFPERQSCENQQKNYPGVAGKKLESTGRTKSRAAGSGLEVDDSELHRKKEKSPKKVLRTDTVIYKGPVKDIVKVKKNPSLDKVDVDPTVTLSPIPIIINPPTENDRNHLKVPVLEAPVINVKTPFSREEAKVEQDATDVVLEHHFRQHCMLELLKVIDAKMMVHHDRKDSSRSKRRRHERSHRNLTPSPDSVHRMRSHRRKSKSPERHPSPRHPSRIQSSPSGSLVTLSLSSKHGKSPQDSRSDKTGREAAGLDFELSELRPRVAQELTPACPSKEVALSNVELAKGVTNSANVTDNLCVPSSPPTPRQQDEASLSPANGQLPTIPTTLGTNKVTNSPATKTSGAVPPLHRRSSDSDLSITPKGNSLAGSDRSMGGYLKPTTAIVRTMNQNALEMLEYPFITLQQYPPGFVLHIGGLVSARSVKLVERISNLEEPEGRDSWWTEIRMEVRSHARALGCNVVLGYREEISICDDVCVLNASGTAAAINLHNSGQDADMLSNRLQTNTLMTNSTDSDRNKQQKAKSEKCELENSTVISSGQQTLGIDAQQQGKPKRKSESNEHESPYVLPPASCVLCHLPYSESSVPFRVSISKCSVCRRAKVPDVLFTTIDLPENIPMTGRGCFIQATVCKCKRDLRGELNAKEISDCLPFLEYEMHSLLLNKLRVKGMNAVFGLKVQISIGERMVIGMATGTAVFLTALPAPAIPQIASGNSWHNEDQLADIRKSLAESVRKNREFYQLKAVPDMENGRQTASDTDESDDELPEMDLGLGTKDACVLEVDDVEDMDRIALLMDDRPPLDIHVVNTQTIPGLEELEIVRNLQMFIQVSRTKIPAGQFTSMPSKYFARLLQTIYFKLRRMIPCALCDMQFKVALPEQDEIQLSVVGMALGLGETTKGSKFKRKAVTQSSSKDHLRKADDSDMIFSLDEDQTEMTTSNDSTQTQGSNAINTPVNSGTHGQKPRPRSPLQGKSHVSHSHRHKHVPLKERYGVDITPLSYLPGGRIERYLGNLNFFFIRESTSIRENGGLSGFTHSFVNEVLAIVRANITALGGNAMVAFFMTQCVLLHSPHKNHGQCLINVGGDVVSVSYFGNEKQPSSTNC